jgi:hypothetical protein
MNFTSFIKTILTFAIFIARKISKKAFTVAFLAIGFFTGAGNYFRILLIKREDIFIFIFIINIIIAIILLIFTIFTFTHNRTDHTLRVTFTVAFSALGFFTIARSCRNIFEFSS